MLPQSLGYSDELVTGYLDLHDTGLDLAERIYPESFYQYKFGTYQHNLDGQKPCQTDPLYPRYCIAPLVYDTPLPVGMSQPNRIKINWGEFFSVIDLSQPANAKLYILSDDPYFLRIKAAEASNQYIHLLFYREMGFTSDWIENAKAAYKQYNLIAGQKLSPAQVQQLKEPILWPTWRQACVGTEKCISFTLYIPAYILDDPRAKAQVWIGEGKSLNDIPNFCTRAADDNTPCNGGLDHKSGTIYSEGDLIYDQPDKKVRIDAPVISDKKISVTADSFEAYKNAFIFAVDETLVGTQHNIDVTGSWMQGKFVQLQSIDGKVSIKPDIDVAGNVQAAKFISSFDLFINGTKGIYDEASHKFINGSYTAISQGDIVERTLHTTRVYEIYQYAGVFHLTHAIDEHPHLSYIAGDANYKAKNYIGKGTFKHVGGKIQLEIEGNVDISAITTRAVNIHSEEDCGLFSCSERTDIASVTETTVPESHAKQIQIAAGGTCNIEGAQMEGDKIIIKCREGISFNGHKVENFYHMTISESGFLGADVPVFDAFSSNNPGKVVRDKIGFLNALNKAAHMHGPLDLAGVMSAVSQGYRLYKDIAFLQSQGGYGLGGAIIMSIVNQLASATVSFGSRETEYHGRSVYTIGNKLFGEIIELWSKEDIDATQVDIEGTESVKVGAKNLKLKSGQNTRNTEFKSESASFDFTISPLAAGAGFSYSTQEGSSQSVRQNPSSIKAPKIEITVDEKLEIISSFIDGKEVDITAAEVEIRDLLDTEYSETSASGFSLGVSINFAGGATPYGSINTFDEVKSSGFINFLSRITGQSVHITAQKLIHNAAHIKGENVTLDVEDIEYVELPAEYQEFESFGMNMGVSAGLDGTFNPSFGFGWSDGDTVISAYVDSALIEAAQALAAWMEDPWGEEAAKKKKELEEKLEALFDEEDKEEKEKKLELKELKKKEAESLEALKQARKKANAKEFIKKYIEFYRNYGQKIKDAVDDEGSSDPAKKERLKEFLLSKNPDELEDILKQIQYYNQQREQAEINAWWQASNDGNDEPILMNAASHGDENPRVQKAAAPVIGGLALSDLVFGTALIAALTKAVQDSKKAWNQLFQPTTSAAAGGAPDPDWEPDDDKFKQYEKFKKQDGSERYECESAESPRWKELKNYKGEYKTNGLQGRDKQYYRWDMRHKDIEIYDKEARYLGSKDPVTGKLYRPGTMERSKKLWNIIK